MATVRLHHLRAAFSRYGGGSPPPPWRLLRLSSRAVRSFSSAMSPPSKAVVYDEQGAPDAVCRVRELPRVPIKDGDVCVRMLAAPINPSDINRIEGFFSLFSRLCRLFQFTALESCTVLYYTDLFELSCFVSFSSILKLPFVFVDSLAMCSNAISILLSSVAIYC